MAYMLSFFISNIFYAKKKIDRQYPEIRLRFRVCFHLILFLSNFSLLILLLSNLILFAGCSTPVMCRHIS